MGSIDQSEAARFVRRENVKRFRWLLEQAPVEAERTSIQTLLAEELQKQVEAGDPLDPATHLNKKQTKDRLDEQPSSPARPSRPLKQGCLCSCTVNSAGDIWIDTKTNQRIGSICAHPAPDFSQDQFDLAQYGVQKSPHNFVCNYWRIQTWLKLQPNFLR